MRDGAARLGAGQVRRRAAPGRQGVPSRRKTGGDADPAGVRAGRRQPAHLDRGWGRSRTGTRSSRTSRCTARARSSTRGWTTRRSSRSPPRAGSSATCATTPDLITAKLAGAALLPAGDSGAAAARRAASTRRRPSAATSCSTARRGARSCHVPPLFTEPAGTCTRRRRSASTTSRPSRSPDERYRTAPLARPVDAPRRAASTTTAVSRRSRTSSTHYDSVLRPRADGRREARPGRVPEVAARLAVTSSLRSLRSPRDMA